MVSAPWEFIGNCTANGSFKKNGKWHVLTARHCFLGTTWKAAWYSGAEPWAFYYDKKKGKIAVRKRKGHSYMRKPVGPQHVHRWDIDSSSKKRWEYLDSKDKTVCGKVTGFTAGKREFHVDKLIACKGDSGGPVFIPKDDGAAKLVGLQSRWINSSVILSGPHKSAWKAYDLPSITANEKKPGRHFKYLGTTCANAQRVVNLKYYYDVKNFEAYYHE